MLFEEQIARKPNLYPWTQEFIDRIWAGFWTPNEFDFKADYGQFKTELTDQERQVVVRTLSAIGQVEIAVKRFWAQLGNNFPHPSMYDLGYWMAATEVTRNLAYEKLLETLRLGDVFEENLKEPVVRNRVEYLRKYRDRAYTDDRKQFVYAIKAERRANNRRINRAHEERAKRIITPSRSCECLEQVPSDVGQRL